MGHLQVRGSSARIGHYAGYKGKTRMIEWHKITLEDLEMVNSGKQYMVNKNLNSGSDLEMTRGRRLVWSRLRASGVLDPGSNPGDPTNQNLGLQCLA